MLDTTGKGDLKALNASESTEITIENAASAYQEIQRESREKFVIGYGSGEEGRRACRRPVVSFQIHFKRVHVTL